MSKDCYSMVSNNGILYAKVIQSNTFPNVIPIFAREGVQSFWNVKLFISNEIRAL